jgi:hypothetical protein
MSSQKIPKAGPSGKAGGIDWNAVSEAALVGARLVRGLTKADHEDAAQTGREAVALKRGRISHPERYAQTSAYHAALGILNARKRESELDGDVADHGQSLASGKRARPQTKLSPDELTKLGKTRDALARHINPFVASLERLGRDGLERGIYVTLGQIIEHCLERTLPEDFIDRLVAYRQRYIHLGGEGQWVESSGTVNERLRTRGRPSATFDEREAQFGRMVVGGGEISCEALYCKRLRREAAERIVDRALELCGYTSEEVHLLDDREAAKWAQQREKWAAKPADADGEGGRHPAFQRQRKRS